MKHSRQKWLNTNLMKPLGPTTSGLQEIHRQEGGAKHHHKKQTILACPGLRVLQDAGSVLKPGESQANPGG